jgi:hypothetical protein
LKRAVALLLAGAALAAAAGWVVVHPARHDRAANRSHDPAVPEATEVAIAPVADIAPRPGQAGAPEQPSGASYFAQLDGAKRSFAAETPDAAWAAHAQAELRAAVQGNLSARAARMALADDLQIDCRTHHCRVSVAIPPGRTSASIPVVVEMAEALQRAAPAVAAIGSIVGANVEATERAEQRRYALYLRREPTSER